MPTVRQSYCTARSFNFSRQHDFSPGHGRPRKGWLFASAQERQRVFRHTGTRDEEPLFESAGFEMPLGRLVGEVDEDGDLISLWVDPRRFEPMPEKVRRRR
jgi:hypothetical protein